MANARPAKRSEARERLLATASGLFYAEGINKVGVDRIVAASNVTLATFYRHFPRKQDLVVAYLNAAHQLEAQRMEALVERASGRELVRAVGDDIVAMIGSPDFRGCAFIHRQSDRGASYLHSRRRGTSAVDRHDARDRDRIRRRGLTGPRPRAGRHNRRVSASRDSDLSRLAAGIGAALHAHRTERGMSLGELSRASGLSRAILARIEGGAGNPSVETLWRVSRALNLPLGALLVEDQEPLVRVIRAREGKESQADSGMRMWLLHAEGRERRSEMYELVLEKGTE
jgi:AcrR family transcriptional regulator